MGGGEARDISSLQIEDPTYSSNFIECLRVFEINFLSVSKSY
jgi:hypothetical protein